MFLRRKKKAPQIQPIFKVFIIGADEETEQLLLYNYISNYMKIGDENIREEFDKGKLTKLDTPMERSVNVGIFKDSPRELSSIRKTEVKKDQKFKEKEFKEHIGKMKGFNPFKINDEKKLLTEIEKHGTAQIKKIIQEPKSESNSPTTSDDASELSESESLRRKNRRRRSKSDMKPQSPVVGGPPTLNIPGARRTRNKRSKTVLSPRKGRNSFKSFLTPKHQKIRQRPSFDRSRTVGRFDLPKQKFTGLGKSARALHNRRRNNSQPGHGKRFSLVRKRPSRLSTKSDHPSVDVSQHRTPKNKVMRPVHHKRNFSLDFQEERLMIDFSNLFENETFEVHDLTRSYYNVLLSNMKVLAKKYKLVKMKAIALDDLDEFIEDNLLDLSLKPPPAPSNTRNNRNIKRDNYADEDEDRREEDEETEEDEEEEEEDIDSEESTENDESEEEEEEEEGEDDEDEEEEEEEEEEMVESRESERSESEIESDGSSSSGLPLYSPPTSLDLPPPRPPNFHEVYKELREELRKKKRKMNELKEQWITLRKERIDLEKIQDLKRAEIRDISTSHEKCLKLILPHTSASSSNTSSKRKKHFKSMATSGGGRRNNHFSIISDQIFEEEMIEEEDIFFLDDDEVHNYNNRITIPYKKFKLKFMKKLRRGMEIFNMDLKPGFKRLYSIFDLSFDLSNKSTTEYLLTKVFFKFMNFNRFSICEFLTLQKNEELLEMFIKVYFENVLIPPKIVKKKQKKKRKKVETNSEDDDDEDEDEEEEKEELSKSQRRRIMINFYFEYFVQFLKYFLCPKEGQKISRLISFFSKVYYEQKIKKELFGPQLQRDYKHNEYLKSFFFQHVTKRKEESQEEEGEGESEEDSVDQKYIDDFTRLGLSIVFINQIVNPVNKKKSLPVLPIDPLVMFLEENTPGFQDLYLRSVFKEIKNEDDDDMNNEDDDDEEEEDENRKKKNQFDVSKTVQFYQQKLKGFEDISSFLVYHKYNTFELLFSNENYSEIIESMKDSNKNSNNNTNNTSSNTTDQKRKKSKGGNNNNNEKKKKKKKKNKGDLNYFELLRNSHFFILVWKDDHLHNNNYGGGRERSNNMKSFRRFVRFMQKFENTKDKIIIINYNVSSSSTTTTTSATKINHHIFPFPIFNFSENLNCEVIWSQIFDYILKPKVTEISSLDYFDEFKNIHNYEKSLKKMDFSQLVMIPKMYI